MLLYAFQIFNTWRIDFGQSKQRLPITEYYCENADIMKLIFPWPNGIHGKATKEFHNMLIEEAVPSMVQFFELSFLFSTSFGRKPESPSGIFWEPI